MDQAEFGYDDFIDTTPKTKRKPLVLVLILALIILLLGIGGYAVWRQPDLLPFLAQLRAAPAEEAPATPTPQEPAATVAAGLAITDQPEPTATEIPPTEAPPEPALESILPAPEFGRLVQTRANGDASREEQALKLAGNMAIYEPFQWEYFEYDPETIVKDVERYYIGLVNKEMGYLMTFNDKYPDLSLAIFKFKQDGRRITIQFFEGRKDQSPAAIIFYEGW